MSKLQAQVDAAKAEAEAKKRALAEAEAERARLEGELLNSAQTIALPDQARRTFHAAKHASTHRSSLVGEARLETMARATGAGAGDAWFWWQAGRGEGDGYNIMLPVAPSWVSNLQVEDAADTVLLSKVRLLGAALRRPCRAARRNARNRPLDIGYVP
ncbi:hypothetical protein DPM13_14860 [Paracoccus mutanolyticus]|uniref:Uncharacterized protein n=1 Tax=Paracoccus mutanolyticus TaxID=1499308 RepID=A0ABM6WT99_9RHOB|nr:hypothetical protein [Paracoccus mutanolyticus]AWX93872.1 hypothetical protein DPM13_14860 [Paracoccus mutanolyticus]